MQPKVNTLGTILTVLSASLATGSVLGPREQAPRPLTAELKQVWNPRFTGHNGPAAVARAHLKYGLPVPDYLLQAAEATQMAKLTERESGHVPAIALGADNSFVSPVQIGTPPKTLSMLLDTGSTDLWAVSTDTIPIGKRNDSETYDPSKSCTARRLDGFTYNVTYGEGVTVTGREVFLDVVSIGGVTVENQAVVAGRDVPPNFYFADDFAGLIGASFKQSSQIKPEKQASWLENAADSGVLSYGLFTADLKHNEPGTYYFGSIPREAGPVVNYAPVNTSGDDWLFDTSSRHGGSFKAIADTGTAIVLLETAATQDYYKNVKSAKLNTTEGGYVFDCDEDLPDYTFTVGDGAITVPGRYVNWTTAAAKGQCYGGIQPFGSVAIPPPFALLGDVALKSAYVVFDVARGRIGWSQKVAV